MTQSKNIAFSSLAVLGIAGVIYYFKRHVVTTQTIQMSQQMTFNQILKIYSKDFAQSKSMQKIIPRAFNSQKDLQNLTNNLFYRKQNSHLNSLTKSLSQPIWDLLDRGGKRWRPILCMLTAQLYGKDRSQVYDIAALCQIVHNGTLIVDDIEDNSHVRRDKPCVHLIYGVDISVNAGNFMYFAPLKYLLKSGKYSTSQLVKMGQIYAEEMTNLHIGQGWDILWHNIERLEGKYPTQNDYLQMTAHKTGVLARLSTRLVCNYLNLSDKQSKILSKFAQTMGVAFQIQDDILNLQGQQFIKTKGYSGEDIHQGKITLMVIHTLSNGQKKSKDRLIEILKKNTTDRDEISEAIRILRNTGSIQYAKTRMNFLIDNSLKQIRLNLPNNVYRNYLEELAFYGIQRTK